MKGANNIGSPPGSEMQGLEQADGASPRWGVRPNPACKAVFWRLEPTVDLPGPLRERMTMPWGIRTPVMYPNYIQSPAS